MTVTADVDSTTIARGLRELVAREAPLAEQERTLTGPIVEAMWDSGLMQYMNPAEAGGSEPGFREMIETWIEMAWQDGSFGWCGIANFPSSAAAGAYLPDDGFAEVFTAHANRSTLGGQFFPNGQGIRVDGGYRVSGSWQFGSGTGHSRYVAAGFLPVIDGALKVADDGQPELWVAIVPREEVDFADGWHVQGLRGTGSYDYHLADVFVPDHRTFPLFTRDAKRGGAPAFRMGLMPITAAGHAGWALGVAKSMLDDVAEFAATKMRMGDTESLAHRTTFQRGYAHHLGMWRAARAGVVEAFEAAEGAVLAGDELTVGMRADMRISACYATEASREVAQWAHLAAGTYAIRDGSRLERAFRDLYTGTQHAFISERVYCDSAKVLLGLVDDHRGL